MELDIARFLNDKDSLLRYLARENIVPVKASEWSKYEYILRRNEKTEKRQIGTHFDGTETTASIIKALGVYDDKTCKQVGEQIKALRKSLNYT
jgi:hypothetical protein